MFVAEDRFQLSSTKSLKTQFNRFDLLNYFRLNKNNIRGLAVDLRTYPLCSLLMVCPHLCSGALCFDHSLHPMTYQGD